MKKILLIGHGGFYNRGCEAIVRGTVEIIKHYVPDSEIILCSYVPEEDAALTRENHLRIDKFIPAIMKGAKKPSVRWIWQTFNRRILSLNTPFQEFLHRPFYRRSDVVVSIGGDNFTDDYGSPKIFFDSLIYAKKEGAKTVIWAASVGPFHDKRAIKKWTNIMTGVDLITVREDLTARYLESLGVTDNVRRVADPAFLIPCNKPSNPPFKFCKSSLTIGIGMSGLISRYCIKREEYTRIFADFIHYIWKSLGGRVFLVPHVTRKTQEVNNDVAVCNEVKALLPTSCPLVILNENYYACEIKYCISQCDFFIGARTHSTIASLSMEIPTITIAYSNKARGINWQLLGTDEFAIPITEVSCDRLITCFTKLQEKASEIRCLLHNRLPSIRSLAMKGGEYLVEILS